jgi:hypothetical protein
MTKSDELSDIITCNMNKNKVTQSAEEEDQCHYQDQDIEVSGSESSKSPLVLFADEPTDMDLIDKLYFKSKYKPLEEQFAESWDKVNDGS